MVGGYILKLKQDPWGSTFWIITTTGINYLHALERFENPQPSEPAPLIAVFGTPAVGVEPPIPAPKKRVAPFLERTMLRIGHIIRWEEMPTHLTAHLTYDMLKYLVLLIITLLVGGVSLSLYYLIHFLIKRAFIRSG
jgi:hypothetical protein